MSLLKEICKKRNALKHSKTLLTNFNGDVLQEEFIGNKRYLIPVSKSDGYVVDIKPDLQVAEILPGLFFGSQDPTQQIHLLLDRGITHILSIGIHVEEYPDFSYTYIPALDLPEFNLRTILEQCFSLIDAIREQGDGIYVHCNAGVSRSASVVIAYLMREINISFKEAYKIVREVRVAARPNQGFMKQLLVYEEELTINK